MSCTLWWSETRCSVVVEVYIEVFPLSLGHVWMNYWPKNCFHVQRLINMTDNYHLFFLSTADNSLLTYDFYFYMQFPFEVCVYCFIDFLLRTNTTLKTYLFVKASNISIEFTLCCPFFAKANRVLKLYLRCKF